MPGKERANDRRAVVLRRREQACEPLASYLSAITAPLTASRALSNIGDSLRFTTLSFSADPRVAERQLCHRSS